MPFSNGRALVIGVGEYFYANQLSVAQTTADAEALADILCDAATCGYLTERVQLLTGAAADSGSILAALDELKGTAEHETVLLFYSGHGHYGEDGSYYLTSYNTELTGVPGNRKVVAGTAVSQTDLIARLQLIRAGRLLLIINACHAGEISPVLDGDTEEAIPGTVLPESIAAAILATGSGRIIITACRSQQFSFVGTGKRTIFTQTLIDALTGQLSAIVDRGGYISAFDLYAALYAEVETRVMTLPSHLRAKYGGTQQPELTVLKGVGSFAVALYRGATAPIVSEPLLMPNHSMLLHEVTQEESERALRHIIGVGQGVVVSGSMSGNTIASGGQSKVTVSSGGNYVAGNQTTQQGVWITHGTISGPVIGTMSGGTLAYHADRLPIIESGGVSIAEALVQIEATLNQIDQMVRVDLRDSLESVALKLRQAQRAARDGETGRAQEKLVQATRELDDLAYTELEAQHLAALLRQVR